MRRMNVKSNKKVTGFVGRAVATATAFTLLIPGIMPAANASASLYEDIKVGFMNYQNNGEDENLTAAGVKYTYSGDENNKNTSIDFNYTNINTKCDTIPQQQQYNDDADLNDADYDNENDAEYEDDEDELTLCKPRISKMKYKSRKIKFMFAKMDKNANGYEVRFSSKKSMKSCKKMSYTGTGNRSIKRPCKSKYVFAQVRTYAINDNHKIYSSWSSVKCVKTAR